MLSCFQGVKVKDSLVRGKATERGGGRRNEHYFKEAREEIF